MSDCFPSAKLSSSLLATALEQVNFKHLRSAIGTAQVVLIGESTHGTEEFYRIRARITQELIEHEGFDFVAVEADWPDAYSINRFVQSSQSGSIEEAFQNFERFPQWMWKNNACADFADWLRAFNSNKVDSSKVGFFGLDMYSMYRSMDKVLEYLQHVDPQAASAASERYEALDEYRNNPFDYARDVYLKLIPEQASNVLEVLLNLLSNVPEYMRGRGGFIDGDELFYTIQNAQLVVDAEEYYRATLTGKNSWNLRDTHMFRTLKLLLAHHQKKKLASSSQIERYDGRPIRCVVWAHNSHVGDERASAIAEHRGQINLGQLVREEFGLSKTYIIGFSTYQGTVLAARHWDTPGRVFELNKGVDGSVEALLHSFVAQAQFFSRTTPGSSANNDFIVYFRVNSATSAAQVPDTTDHLQAGQSKEIQTSENKQNEEVPLISPALVSILKAKRIFRFVGVQYVKDREIQAHYINVQLSEMFDCLIHIDSSTALSTIKFAVEPV